MTERKRPLSDNQRHVLQVLAEGGMLVHHAGVRGFMRGTTLMCKGASSGAEVNARTFDSLLFPGGFPAPIPAPEPLVEHFKPRGVNLGMGRALRITKAGREALRNDTALRAAKLERVAAHA